MNPCYLPNASTVAELLNDYGDQLERVKYFDKKVGNQIQRLLGETYVLKDVLQAFEDFSNALSPLINPNIEFGDGQVRAKDMSNKFDIYDKYFEVNRVENMTKGQFIQQYLDTSAELIQELQHTSMSRGEVAYILKGWEAANEILIGNKEGIANFQIKGEKDIDIEYDNEKRALYRWKLAHHGFAIFMIFSGHCFNKIIADLEKGEVTETTAIWMDRGAHLFRATTACMEFGNSFTAQVYKSVVRPDMSKANEEANLPNGFSGTQNFEYIVWRKAKVALFKLLKASYDEFPEYFKEKVELFRAFYLEDMHIHSIIAGRMVGVEKSLLQEGFARKKAITAGDMLRMMAGVREKEVSFILGK